MRKRAEYEQNTPGILAQGCFIIHLHFSSAGWHAFEARGKRVLRIDLRGLESMLVSANMLSRPRRSQNAELVGELRKHTTLQCSANLIRCSETEPQLSFGPTSLYGARLPR
jgi:hypothetical protein